MFDVYSVCAGVSVVSFYTAVGVLVPRFSFKYFLNRINHKVKAVAAPPLFIFSVSHPVQTQLKKNKYTNCPKCDSVPLENLRQGAGHVITAHSRSSCSHPSSNLVMFVAWSGLEIFYPSPPPSDRKRNCRCINGGVLLRSLIVSFVGFPRKNLGVVSPKLISWFNILAAWIKMKLKCDGGEERGDRNHLKWVTQMWWTRCLAPAASRCSAAITETDGWIDGSI